MPRDDEERVVDADPDASVGDTVETSVNAAITVIRPEPMPRPNKATPRGSPAATTEPNASSRMIAAAPTPTSSAAPSGACTFSGTCPPNATW